MPRMRIRTVISKIKNQGKSLEELAAFYEVEEQAIIDYIDKNTKKKVFNDVMSTLTVNNDLFAKKKKDYETSLKEGEDMAKLTQIVYERPEVEELAVDAVPEVQETFLDQVQGEQLSLPAERTEEQIKLELEQISQLCADKEKFLAAATESLNQNRQKLEELQIQVELLQENLEKADISLKNEQLAYAEICQRKLDLEDELGSLNKVYLVAPLYSGKRQKHDNEITSDESMDIPVVTDIQEIVPIDFALAEELGMDSISKFRKLHKFVNLVLNFKLGNEVLTEKYGTRFEVVYKKGSMIERLLRHYECIDVEA